MCRHLSVAAKKGVCVAVVLSTLLYAEKTWTVKAAHLRQVNTFHFDRVCTKLGETQHYQWAKILSKSSLAACFGLGVMLLISLGSTVFAGSATWPVWIPPIYQSKCSLRSYR